MLQGPATLHSAAFQALQQFLAAMMAKLLAALQSLMQQPTLQQATVLQRAPPAQMAALLSTACLTHAGLCHA
jgi:hypothetical protein